MFQETIALGENIVSAAQNKLQQPEGYQFIALGYDPEDRRHIENLEASWRFLQGLSERDPSVAGLISRVANSLGRAVMQDPTKRDEAKSYFEKSIELKKNSGDLKGLAISYGALGDLYLDNGDIEKARENYLRDLEISRKIGDRPAQSRMSSLLGECDLRQRKYEDALSQYVEAFKAALPGSPNEFFARIGEIRSLNGTQARMISNS